MKDKVKSKKEIINDKEKLIKQSYGNIIIPLFIREFEFDETRTFVLKNHLKIKKSPNST